MKWGAGLAALLLLSAPLLQSCRAKLMLPKFLNPINPPTNPKVTVYIDQQGLPTIEAGSLAQGYYGLGYATARLRLFQAYTHVMFTEGRLSEWFAKPSGTPEADALNAQLLESDRKMRTLGFSRHHQAVLRNIPAEQKAWLEAFAAGINTFLSDPSNPLPPDFAAHGLTRQNVPAFEPHFALSAFDRITDVFSGMNFQDEIKRYKCEVAYDPAVCATTPEPCRSPPPIDDAIAIVPRPPQFASRSQSTRPLRVTGTFDTYKASNAAAIHGSKTVSGRAMLYFDPKLGLTLPSPLFAFRLVVPAIDLDLQGAAVAGSPGALVFHNQRVGQTLTASSGDTADAVRLKPLSEDTYEVDGQSRSYSSRSETIRVRHGTDVTLSVKESSFGPIVNDITPWTGLPPMAAKLAAFASNDSHSMLSLMRAQIANTLVEYQQAIENWRAPTANAVVATHESNGTGHIAYFYLAAIPKRKELSGSDGTRLTGDYPMDGSLSNNDWNGFLGATERPRVIDPPEGMVVSANNLFVGSWFSQNVAYLPLPTGDTARGLQLRSSVKSLLAANPKVSFEQLHAVHSLSRHKTLDGYLDLLRRARDRGLLAADDAANARNVLAALEIWDAAGRSLRSDQSTYPLIQRLLQGREGLTDLAIFRRFGPVRHPTLSCHFNKREPGLARFLREYEADPDGVLSAFQAPIRSLLIDVANANWDDLMASGFSSDPASWPAATPVQTTLHHGPWNLCLNEVALPRKITYPACAIPIAGSARTTTFLSPLGLSEPEASAYSRTVEMGPGGRAQGLFAAGNSEDPSSAGYDSQLNFLTAAGSGDASQMPMIPTDPIPASPAFQITLSFD
jgi:acyl-homoserine lactone acylase PvdQ